jgi:hypothetical protein
MASSHQKAMQYYKTMSLWDSVRDSIQKTAEKAGSVAMIAGQKTKLNAETLLVDRDISLRKQAFGVELYDYVAPLSSTPEFYASDDKLTDTLRPPLLMAQREIAALEIRKKAIKEQQAQAEVTRKAAFPTPAQSIGGQILNAGKSATLAANEAKLMTDMASITRLIQAQKEEFGEKLFETLVELEDKEGWLPTDRDIRALYDQTRRDVEKLIAKRKAKEQELAELDDPHAAAKQNGQAPAVYATPTVPTSQQNGSSSFQPPATAAPVVASMYGSTTQSSFGSSAPQQTAPAQHDPFASSFPPAATTPAPAMTSSFSVPQQATMNDPFALNNNSMPAQSPANSFPSSGSYGSTSASAANNNIDMFANTTGYSGFLAPPTSTNSNNNTFDPFAGMAAPPSSSVDPFASTTATSNSDPFAGLSTTAAPADPFAGTIFAGTSSQGTTNNPSHQQFGMR